MGNCVRNKTSAIFAAAVLVVLIGFMRLGDVAFGQSPRSVNPTPAGTDSNGPSAFRPVQGAEREQVPGGLMLVAAYGVVWLLLLAYIVHIGRMQTRLQRDLERLEQAFNAGSRPDEQAPEKKANKLTL
jgi:CcmD family protein